MAKTECIAADTNRALTSAKAAPRLLSLLTYVVAGAAVALNGGWFPQQQVILLAAAAAFVPMARKPQAPSAAPVGSNSPRPHPHTN